MDAELVGHAPLVERLWAAVQRGALGHAILLTGASSVGKTAAATVLAGRMLDASSWPGGLQAHPDFWLEDGPAENISIERVRAGGKEPPTLQAFLALQPYAAGRRVALIARAERLTEPAANTLLKTIEEPPPETWLILCTAQPERLPQTILSRCETFALGPVPTADIGEWLVRAHHVTQGDAVTAARMAGGRPGRARALALDAEALALELSDLDAFIAAGGSGIGGAIATAATVTPSGGAEGRERAITTIVVWAGFVRDAICYSIGAPELAVWTSHRAAVERWAEELSAASLISILQRLMDACEAIATYAQPRLTFDSLLIDIFGGAHSPPTVEGATRVLRETSQGRPRSTRARRTGGR